ncbi:MAG: calcium-binding protein [Candidatus Sericytochromatia bacterium]
MKKVEEKNREEKIESEILADCYNSHDQLLAWYDYLQEYLAFPFEATLKDGTKVNVIDMTPLYQCEEEKAMLVEIDRNGEITSESLFEVDKAISDERTKEALKDWAFWVDAGNRFEDEDGFY